MNTELTPPLQKEKAGENAHLEMSRRMRGVRFARIRCRLVWSDTLYSRDARHFFNR